MKKDTGLDPIRNREDFKKLVDELAMEDRTILIWELEYRAFLAA